MTDLLNYIKAENATKAAWIAEDPENRWTGMITEDLDHWASMDIYTVEDYELHMAQVTYSDFYKDVFGFRPRHDTSAWTKEQWKEELDFLGKQLEHELEAERLEKEQNVSEFKEWIKSTIRAGAKTYDQALKWMYQGSGEQDVDSFLYSNGVLFTDYGNEVKEDLRKYFN